MTPLRSLLFCPASELDKLMKALGSTADVVVADLEDSVAGPAKEHARSNLRDLVRQNPGVTDRLMVRINTQDKADKFDDLELVSQIVFRGVLVPKATPEIMNELPDRIGQLYPIIETAKGVAQSAVVAEDPRVEALVFGAVDLAVEVSFEWNRLGTHLLYCRSKIVMDSAAAGIQPPIDSAYPHFRDMDGLIADATAAREVGFQGKCCIHPRQLEPVHDIFQAPGIEWANEILAAYESLASGHAGVGSREGEMIDMATVRRARMILVRHGSDSQAAERESDGNLS